MPGHEKQWFWPNPPFCVFQVLAFVNAVLISTIDFNDRRNIRNEFIGLGFLELLNELRHENDEELHTQIRVFEEHKGNDDDMMVSADGFDLNDHQQVREHLWSTTNSSISLVVNNVIPLLIGPSTRVPKTLSMCPLGGGNPAES